MVRYTILRFLIFFGVVLALWLVGLRNNTVLLIGLSVVISAALSYVLLRGMRDELTAKIAAWDEERRAAKAQGGGARHPSADDLAEDAEVDRTDRTDRTDRPDAQR